MSRGKLGILLQEHLDLVKLVSGELQLRGPLCPNFVIELRSPSASPATLQAKMREYVENGARLGWLLDPEERKPHVYKPGEPARVLNTPDKLSAGPVLTGLVLDLKQIWEPTL